ARRERAGNVECSRSSLRARTRRALAALFIIFASTVAAPFFVFPQAGAHPAQALPAGFRSISLGMGLDQVKKALSADPLFVYRGDPDVSFLPQTDQYLIECPGTTYLRRAYFQFADSRLFIMILVLDTQKLDHYSIFSALSAKYGPPGSLSPQESVWQSDTVRLSLERPLTVKYVDNKTFSAILAKGGAQKDLDQLSREKFIEQF
ncbi:MAG TPA: hypothetical protein VFB30_11450, partial [Spirochaetia bacterium]|nr:hypothetical protein [Spirochaetia bacterium]